MYNHEGKVQICVGACSGLLSWIAGLSFSQDVIPIISYIGVCAGAFIALHGCYVIISGWFKKMKKRNSSWY